MSRKSLKFPPQAPFAMALSLLVIGFVLPPRGFAREARTDPNLIQRVEQFIDKPSPHDLLLKPKPYTHKKTAKDAKD